MLHISCKAHHITRTFKLEYATKIQGHHASLYEDDKDLKGVIKLILFSDFIKIQYTGKPISAFLFWFLFHNLHYFTQN